MKIFGAIIYSIFAGIATVHDIKGLDGCKIYLKLTGIEILEAELLPESQNNALMSISGNFSTFNFRFIPDRQLQAFVLDGFLALGALKVIAFNLSTISVLGTFEII